MKLRRVIAWTVAVLIAVPVLLAFALWAALARKGQPYVERAMDPNPHRFAASAIFAASDADMVGTSYADGILYPLVGAHDALSRVDVDRESVQSSEGIVTNSVTAWPGTLELSPDARFAYVIES